MKVAFFKHNIGNDEINECKQVLQTFFLTTGQYVNDFEDALAKYLNIRNSVGLTSCTGALQLALLAAGIKHDDEVITTPMSFVATANSICMTGAKPVFVDVEKQTGNIDVNKIEKTITKKTKAILPVHLYGQMVDMKKILSIAKRYKLVVIEDAAHALESERDGIRPGQKSFGACFSFYATKSITSGEGGAFATNSLKSARLVRQLRCHGITSELAQRERTGIKSYDVDCLGWKYNMDNIQAALLLPQIQKIEAIWKKRAKVYEKYRKAFSALGIEIPKEVENAKHAYHLFPIWVDPKKRGAVLKNLEENGVSAMINYPAIHLFSFYRKKFGYKNGMYPNAEEIARRTISLPLYAKLTDKETDYVIEKVSKAIHTKIRT